MSARGKVDCLPASSSRLVLRDALYPWALDKHLGTAVTVKVADNDQWDNTE